MEAVACGMSPLQAKIYQDYLQDTFEFIKNRSEIEKADLGRYHIEILAKLTRLRQICCHPALITNDLTESSGKIETLMYLLEEARSSSHRCLIFSSFTSALAIIEKHLKSLNLNYFYIDGKTKASERQALVDRFNEGEADVFLISLKAGGSGLNLTGADTVILFDPWWNPAVENQATDRAHRFGQDKTVQVYRLITKNSIEEHMLALQARKKALVEGVIEEGAYDGDSLSIEQLNGLIFDAMQSFNEEKKSHSGDNIGLSPHSIIDDLENFDSM